MHTNEDKPVLNEVARHLKFAMRLSLGVGFLMLMETSPENCLVRNILTDWYNDKTCIYCGQKFEEINWHDHNPALRSPESDFVELRHIPFEMFPTILKTHKPVCRNCFVTENFRRQYPELVTDRPSKDEHYF